MKSGNNIVTATIHNLGNNKIENAQVKLPDREKVIEDKIISHLDAPIDLTQNELIFHLIKFHFGEKYTILCYGQ